jgi:hypothetical protein
MYISQTIAKEQTKEGFIMQCLIEKTEKEILEKAYEQYKKSGGIVDFARFIVQYHQGKVAQIKGGN